MSPRIGPGSRKTIGLPATVFSEIAGRVSGTRPPAIFTTLARARPLFWRWLVFAGGLMPGGKLPRHETELVILRVATLCDCAYEREHHERIGARSGLTTAEIARVADGPGAEGFSPRQVLLLRATDELVRDHRICDETWAPLAEMLSEAELIELCQLAGHYAMLAGTINSLGLEPDRPR